MWSTVYDTILFSTHNTHIIHNTMYIPHIQNYIRNMYLSHNDGRGCLGELTESIHTIYYPGGYLGTWDQKGTGGKWVVA